MNPLLGLASGIAESAATGLINKGFSDSSNREMMKRQHAYNKEQMALQYAYGQRAQKNTASNLVQGLKMAGLSPALAVQGNFAAAPSVTSSGMPSSTPHSFASPVTGVQNFLEMAQAKLVEAESEKVEAEKKIVDNDLERREAEDATHALNSTRLFEKKLADREAELQKLGWSDKKIADDSMCEFYRDMMQVTGNAGSSKAYNEFVNLARNDVELGADVVEATLRYMVANRIIKDSDVLRKLSKRPSADFDEVLSEISRNYAIAFASTSTGNLTYHNDLTSMIEKGDNLGTGVYLGKEIVDVAKSWSPFMLMRRYMKPAYETQKWQKALRSIPQMKGIQGNNTF